MAPLDLEDGRITLFKNDKDGNERRPDFRGELKTPEGTQLRVSLWVSEAKSGKKYLSGRVEALEDQVTTAASGDDDIPF